MSLSGISRHGVVTVPLSEYWEVHCTRFRCRGLEDEGLDDTAVMGRVLNGDPNWTWFVFGPMKQKGK